MNPTLSLAFLNSILVTIGVIAFRSVFHNQCGSVLESTEQRYNDTLEEVNNLYSAAKEDHRKCLENHDKCILEIADLQGRLEGQETLAQKYNLLLAEHQKSMDNVREFQTGLKQKEETLFQQIQLNKEQRDDLIRQSNSQGEEIAITRQGNAKVVEEMAEEMRDRQEEYEKTKRRIQQRHNALCKEK
jgi:peptidoglycan hydrolase CwlO-like protein